MLFCSGHWNLYGSSEQDVIIQLDTPGDSVQMLYRDIFFISKKKIKKEFSQASAFRTETVPTCKEFWGFFMEIITHLHISIWGHFGLYLLQVDSEWALYPKFMENGLFWLRSSAKALHYCNHWYQDFSPPLSPGQAAGNLGITCQALIREGLSPTELELICHVLVSVPRLISMPDFISKSFFICVLLGIPYSPSGIISLGLHVSHHFSSSSLSVHSNPSLKLTSSRKSILLHCQL